MLPSNLKAEQFAAYPSQAQRLAVASLAMLQKLPLSFLPAFLRELMEYDFKFPAECRTIDSELSAMASLSPQEFDAWFRPFSQLKLSLKLEQVDWVNQPSQFLEQESAWLWTTGQQDAFRVAATGYGDRLKAVIMADPLPVRRLGIAIVGQGMAAYEAPLFRYLRPHGTYFSHLKPDNGVALLLRAVEARAQSHPAPYAHWYVDGGAPANHGPAVTGVSWAGLEPMRTALLDYIQKEIHRPAMGPEELRTRLASLAPSEVGMGLAGDSVLDRFQLKLFTEGSGTQIFSTTFAQWTAREALRRAQPLTLLVRFAPRQRQRPMNELLSNTKAAPQLDPAGSLIDGDMGAWYHWINQQRLSGSEQSVFLAWFEGHRQAVAIGPTLPRGAESSSSLDLDEVLSLALN